jgi:tetratricopeptide (TPR) repeat protein
MSAFHPEADTSACPGDAYFVLANVDIGSCLPSFYSQARPLFERALAIREKALGPEHPHTADSLSNLARLLQEQGDLAGARPLFERALTVHEGALGAHHIWTGDSARATAEVLDALGRGEEAAALRCRYRLS